MSDTEVESVSDDVPEFRCFMAPWKEAFGTRVVTSSPIRKGSIICMDLKCNLHGRDPQGNKKAQSEVYKATALEYVVINSFTDIEPKDSCGSNEFTGWTESELHFACYGTDDVALTQQKIFSNPIMHEKMKTYVSMFEGAAEMFLRSADIYKEDPSGGILKCVYEWSGAMDPLMYIWCVRGRNQKLASKIIRLKNTVSIWKDKAEKAKQETAQLKWKLKMAKKNLNSLV